MSGIFQNLKTKLAKPTGADLVGFQQAGTGAVARTTKEKNQELEVNANDYWKIGLASYGVAINLAIERVEALGGGVVKLPAGELLTGETILLADNVSIKGSGQKATTIKLSNSANVNIVEKKMGASGIGVGIMDLTIDGNDANNTIGGVMWIGPNSGRGPSLTMERLRITKCRPVANAPSGEYAAVLLIGAVWGVMRDVDIDQNQYAVGLWHKGSDWQIDSFYLGPNGAQYNGGAGQHSMILQGGAGNIFNNCYFGGNGGLSQVFLWGTQRNLFANCLNDNSWEHGYHFAALGAVGSDDNTFVGGQIMHSGGKNNNTFSAVYFDNSSGNLFIGVGWSGAGHTSSGNAAKHGVKEVGTAGRNYVNGGSISSGYLSGFDGRSANSGSMITALFGWDVSETQISVVKKRLDVQGPYQASAPSTSSVPLGRFNGGGAVSLWAGTFAYNYAWLQAIQDDGSNNIKTLVLNPLGGNVQMGLGTPGNCVSIASGVTNGAIATTLGSVGPVGSTAGTPQGWMRVNVNGTDRFIPYW